MSLSYISVCSGIEAATVAWEPLGFKPVVFSEIEDFPSAVLKHHYPNVVNCGDMTKFKEWGHYEADILVGGTPCQSYSVAGLRKGLEDPRGNLMLTYLAMAAKFQPQALVWENVAGVLSSNGGRDFGTFLWALGELGYGWAYRVLDAQYFGIPQRRRRVFVVGHIGGWERAAEILFEPESLYGHPKPSRTPWEDFASDTKSCTPFDMLGFGHYGNGLMASTCKARDYKDATDLVVHGTQDPCVSDIASAVGRNNGGENVCFAQNSRDEVREMPYSGALCSRPGAKQQSYLRSGSEIRRLTPIECERLQGFPDNYTQIPWNGKPAQECPDGHRYRAIGNSMAVPVMRWLGKRLDKHLQR